MTASKPVSGAESDEDSFNSPIPEAMSVDGPSSPVRDCGATRTGPDESTAPSPATAAESACDALDLGPEVAAVMARVPSSCARPSMGPCAAGVATAEGGLVEPPALAN